MEISKTIPWVEKYRPINFNDIVLSEENREIFKNMFKRNYIPNILLYGPPGTGKTTTIINLIDVYQKNNNEQNKGFKIHLNASDERGVDIIRNQISNFVNSKTMFSKGTKFIILDEVDYMTKNAQQALKYLIEEYRENIRFCLICNYISKIDESLQNEFLKIRFNQLPEIEISKFLNNINYEENLNLTSQELEIIQLNFKSDIRSMVNYMQSNKKNVKKIKLLDEINIKELESILKLKNLKVIKQKFIKLSNDLNKDVKVVIKEYFNYLIRYKCDTLSSDKLINMEIIIHNSEFGNDYLIELIYYLFFN